MRAKASIPDGWRGSGAPRRPKLIKILLPHQEAPSHGFIAKWIFLAVTGMANADSLVD
jgi:hypothetical protein